MNSKYQNQHPSMHHQNRSEEQPQTDISNAYAGETADQDSSLDELEEMMFKRAR